MINDIGKTLKSYNMRYTFSKNSPSDKQWESSHMKSVNSSANSIEIVNLKLAELPLIESILTKDLAAFKNAHISDYVFMVIFTQSGDDSAVNNHFRLLATASY